MGDPFPFSAYLAKVDQRVQKPRVGILSRPAQPYFGRLGAILDLAGGVLFQAVWGSGGAALQVLSECPRNARWVFTLLDTLYNMHFAI